MEHHRSIDRKRLFAIIRNILTDDDYKEIAWLYDKDDPPTANEIMSAIHG